MATAPLRIECYDISQIQGTDVVASMVVFEDGLPRKSEYRRFASAAPPTTCRAMSEVLRRRFTRYLEAGPRPASWARRRRSTPEPAGRSTRPPAGRASSPTRRSWSWSTAARRRSTRPRPALAELGIDDVALCGLAKRLEEVWLPGDEFPVILPRTSEALYLLQRVRDEAHRFAITFHRQRRSKRMTASALDDVPAWARSAARRCCATSAR